MLSSIRICFKRICGTRSWNNAGEKQSQMLQKLLKKQKKREKADIRLLLKPSGIVNSNPYGNEGDSRKITALNKIFMEEVTAVVGSKVDCADLFQSGFEITKVRLTNSRNFLNIYWMVKNNKLSEEDISNKLNEVAVEVKEHIGTLRYYGRVPAIRFVKDKSMENAVTLENIFFSHEFLKDVETTVPEKVVSEFDPDSGEDFPNMRQNVLGLDHSKLKTEIQKEMERHKVFSPKGEFETAQVEPETVVEFDKETFRKFFQKKLRMDKKMDNYTVRYFKPVNEEVEGEEEEDNLTWEYPDEENEKLSTEDCHYEFGKEKK